MKHARQTYSDNSLLEPPARMNRNQHKDTGRIQPAWKRSIPALAVFVLLSGCTTGMPDWVPDLTGGEGQIAQRVSSRIIDDAPAPEHVSTPDIATDTPPIPTVAPVPAAPTREEVLAIQSDLEELGYDPGLVDGIAGLQTREAIKAYQKDLGWVVDGQITQELAVSTHPRSFW